MTPIEELMPRTPSWRVDWQALRDAFEWIRALDGVPHDPQHHAEGDVGVHCRMVAEALADSAFFRNLVADSPDAALALWAATLLHDVAKPATTEEWTDPAGNRRVSQRGHSPRGAIDARRILWRMGLPFVVRETAARLVARHQRPFHAANAPDPEREARRLSLELRCDLLAELALADARGRRCAKADGTPDPETERETVDTVLLFREFAADAGCLDRPFPFLSDHARWSYCRPDSTRTPFEDPHDDRRCDVVLLSGLPGAGKSTWLRRHRPDLPVVSLDALRARLGVAPDEPQAAVIWAAREEARSHLRAGRPFAWDATNLSRKSRGRVLELLHDYGARVEIVYVETPSEAVLRRRNRERGAAAVPDAAIDRMMQRWDPPLPFEAHRLAYVVDGRTVDWRDIAACNATGDTPRDEAVSS